jgi:ABC-2 type transport system ATP-binding protein
VLAIDDLTISEGIYWVKGANGSGKSTFLKIIAGILSFDGEIKLNDAISPRENFRLYRQLINFAEAEPVFPEFLTGKELINVFAQAKAADQQQVDYYIQSMNMHEYVDESIRTYSSGMLKKISLVAAFLGKPSLILLDEPLITMDNESLEILYTWINERSKKDKVSFFLSSHQPLDTNRIDLTGSLAVESRTITFQD